MGQQRVPNELLRHIFSFMPEHDLRNVYGVSKLFYETAMSLRYRELSFKFYDFGQQEVERFGWQPQYIPFPLRLPLSNYNTARFVKEVSVTIDQVKLDESDCEIDRPRVHGRTKPPRPVKESYYAKYIPIWTDIWMHLPSVTHLTLLLNSWSGSLPEYLSALLTTLWTTMGPTIQHFELDTSFEKFQTVFQTALDVPVFPLRSIKVTWRANYGLLTPQQVSRRYALLAAFIKRTCATLESIELTPLCLVHDVGHLFGQLCRPGPQKYPFLRLRQFSITAMGNLHPNEQVDFRRGATMSTLTQIITEGESKLPSFRKFFELYSSQLLSLHLILPPEWYTMSGVVKLDPEHHKWRVPDLSPDIHSLSTNHFPDFESCFVCLQPSVSTGALSNLSIDRLRIDAAEFNSLLQLLHVAIGLKVLRVHLSQLTAEELLIMASSLPNLSTLRVRLQTFEARVWVNDLESMNASGNPALRKWPLETMELSVVADDVNITRANVALWLGKYLPNLKTLNGQAIPHPNWQPGKDGNYITATTCGGLLQYGYLAPHPPVEAGSNLS